MIIPDSFPALRRLVVPAMMLVAWMVNVEPGAAQESRYAFDSIVQATIRGDERFWRQIAEAEPYETMGVRKIYSYAMQLSLGRQHPERLQRLFDLGVRMQDRDAASPGYGNLRWTWRDAKVTDRNAIEFCMQDAVVIWAGHRDWIPEPSRSTLQETMQFGIEGCLRHVVPTSYTNIAILNAGNLIALGEMLDRPDAAAEGYRRLEAICLWTWSFGVHEYNSPTYTGVDLDGLDFIYRYAKRDEGRQQAETLLRLFWTDVAANWFPAASKLAGSQSRSYDYLRGLGYVNQIVQYQGWNNDPTGGLTDLLRPALCQWTPPNDIQEQVGRFPRTVRQSWGPPLAQSRTHVLYPDVSLSTSGATYGNTDMPLTVDLPGRATAVRAYFIADGREDPYGKKRYETSSARHMKALHLQPFWAAAQRDRDALGLVIYRPQDLAADVVTNCQSHFVFRRSPTGFYVDGESRSFPQATSIAIDAPIIARYGTAALGVRVIWTRSQDGRPSEIQLVDDAQSGVTRLTIDHYDESPTAQAGAALWVRVGTSLTDDASFHQWRKDFESLAPVAVWVTDDSVHVEIPGDGGSVLVAAQAPFGQGEVTLQPEPSQAVLEINGEDVGRGLLGQLECVRRHETRMQQAAKLDVPAAAGVYWEAETGLIFPGMSIGDDARVSGGQFIWHPTDDTWGRTTSTATWTLDIAEAGRYFLWGRVLAPNPQTDSFYVGAMTGTQVLVPRSDWHTGSGPDWRWAPVALNQAKEPTAFDLPAGRCRIQFSAREVGTKLDRLFLARSQDQRPQ